MKLKSILTAAVLLASVPIATANHHKEAKTMDIVDTAVAAGSFKTLAAALGAADLVGALKGDGPFTVFAPTDAAFAKLPAGTIDMLLKPENKDKLTDILTYHVVAAKVPAATAVTLDKAEALNGKTIMLTRRGGALYLNDSKVVTTDIMTSNGIIHVIDTVLIPSS
ncbi:MAG: fasciclin domain-containing protein [Opitutaceae bacterium]